MHQRHYYVITLPSWGHSRGELSLACRLIKQQPDILVTVFLADLVKGRCQAVIEGFNLNQEEESRMRLVYYTFATPPPCNPMGGETDDNSLFIFSNWVGQEISPFVRKAINGERVCGGSNEAPHEIPPTILICDALSFVGLRKDLPSIWKERGYKQPDRYLISPIGEVLLTFLYEGSPYQNAFQAYQLYIKDGQTEAHAYEKALFDEGEFYNEGFGCGKMRVSEIDCSPISRLNCHFQLWYNLGEVCRGERLLVTWPDIFNKDKSILPPDMTYIGPQYPPPSPYRPSADPSQTGLTTFLDTCLKRDGPKSVIYVSYGSEQCAATNESANAMFDVLKETNFNVIYVSSSALAINKEYFGKLVLTADETLVKRTMELGQKGFVVDWCDQWNLLAHESIGWFLSHCGSNGSAEAMLRGVPMICNPGAWDQAFNAAQVVQFGAAFPLYQVRTGLNIGRKTGEGILVEGTEEAMKREFQTIFDDIKGEKGDRVRTKMLELKELVLKDTESGHSAQMMKTIGRIGLDE